MTTLGGEHSYFFFYSPQFLDDCVTGNGVITYKIASQQFLCCQLSPLCYDPSGIVLGADADAFYVLVVFPYGIYQADQFLPPDSAYLYVDHSPGSLAYDRRVQLRRVKPYLSA